MPDREEKPLSREGAVAIAKNVVKKHGPGAETIAEHVAIEFEKRGTTPGQRAENIALYFGLFVAGIGILVESIKQLGLAKGQVCADHWWQMVPWFNLAVLFVCVLPKMVGRQTYGKIWESFASRKSA